MEIIKTERKHWINGYQTRGGKRFKSLALSFFFFGVMFTSYIQDSGRKSYDIDFYKFI